VLVGDKKYACESCIKGHRSSTCQHIVRPLYEIKKKGRPVTQCEHCRELRKTKQIHVKCICAHNDDDPGVCCFVCGLGSSKVPASAAFPSGLPPEALGTSVALRSPLPDGSDCERGIGPCDCATRASRHKGKAKARPRGGSAEQASTSQRSREPQVAGPAGIVASAHASGHRPVLPRPPPPSHEATLHGPAHDPSVASTHASRSRPHLYTQSSSHLGDTYNQMARGSDDYGNTTLAHRRTSAIPAATASPDLQSWGISFNGPSPSLSLPADVPLCGCGPTCACPGCIEHCGPDVLIGAECANPNACVACLEYAMLGMPAIRGFNIQGVAYDPQDVDDWLRQMGAAQPQMQSQSQTSVHAGGRGASDTQYDPALLQTYALWNDLHDARTRSRPAQGEWDALDELDEAAAMKCCGGRCQCPPSMCACPPECCGCCQGCSCEGHLCRHGAAGEGGRLMFALSGERGGCCPPSSSWRNS
ncbi:copper-fist transcription factor, partial [Rhodofomes roseus]